MSDFRNPAAPIRPTTDRLVSDAFDAGIFDKVAASREDDRLLVDEASDVDEPAPRREGLPAGFRMRHDTHYVEELISRNHAGRADTAPANKIHARRISPRVAEPKATPSTAMASADIGESLDAIGACLHLFRARTRPAAERVALDLIAAEVARAGWLVQALSVLNEDVPVARGAVDIGPVVSRIARVPGGRPARCRGRSRRGHPRPACARRRTAPHRRRGRHRDGATGGRRTRRGRRHPGSRQSRGRRSRSDRSLAGCAQIA